MQRQALHEHEDAIADYDQAIRSTPDYAEAYCKRGTAKAALGLNDEALEDFETALELARNAGNAKIVAQAESSARTELAKLLIDGLFQKSRVLAQDGYEKQRRCFSQRFSTPT